MLEDEKPPVKPKGGLEPWSIGELLVDGEVDRGWLGGREWECDGKPGGKWSDLELDIINYF